MVAGKLAVKVKKDAGVTLDGDGVAVKGDGKTVTVTADGVGIKVKANGGLESNTGGLQVKAGSGLKTDKDGLEIKLAEKGGLKAELGGLAVYTGAGLEIDANGALTVKAKSGEGNYIASTADGLAITKSGVEAIKAALKSVSLVALNKAVQGTSQGYKLDSNNPAAEDVEAKIAVKLNDAYAAGWHLTQPRAVLFAALQIFRKANTDKFVNTATLAPSSAAGETEFYDVKKVAFTIGQIAVTKINPDGTAAAVEKCTGDGIFALVGKVNDKGVPSSDEGHYTRHALMVTVSGGVRTVVGRWDFCAEDSQWNGADGAATGVWSIAAVHDSSISKESKDAERSGIIMREKVEWEKVATEKGRKAAEEDCKKNMKIAVTQAKKEAELVGQAKGIAEGLAGAFSTPSFTVGGDDQEIELSRNGPDWLVTISCRMSLVRIGSSSSVASGYHFVIPNINYNLFGSNHCLPATETTGVDINGTGLEVRVANETSRSQEVVELTSQWDGRGTLHFYAKTEAQKNGSLLTDRLELSSDNPVLVRFVRPKGNTDGFAQFMVRLT